MGCLAEAYLLLMKWRAACGLPLDVLLVRKLGVPGQEELAMGAIASGGIVVLNRRILHSVHISKETLCAAVERAKAGDGEAGAGISRRTRGD